MSAAVEGVALLTAVLAEDGEAVKLVLDGADLRPLCVTLSKWFLRERAHELERQGCGASVADDLRRNGLRFAHRAEAS